jgi:arginyl-tRNA--protein-N-Asp/Glu arginylyltransferase
VLAQVHFPQSASDQTLDDYLEKGWFRMGQTIFTTNFLNFRDQFYSAIWLRIRLEKFYEDRQFRHLEKLNAHFRVNIQKAEITKEKEELFAKYRSTVTFEASHSLTQLLLGTVTRNVFESYEVTVRDDGKLIACGFFDLGKTSAAGITSFYDPGYRKHSLGKFVIYQKIKHCFVSGLKYFYPGYFVPGYPRFDYKLKIQNKALEFFKLGSQSWFTVDKFDARGAPLTEMVEKLGVLCEVFANSGIKTEVFYYDYFDANLVHSLSHLELLDFPIFLASPPDPATNFFESIIYFDVRDCQYHLVTVDSMWSSGADGSANHHYSGHLLKVASEIFASSSIAEIERSFQTFASG